MSASSIGSSLDIATLVGAMMKPHQARVASYSTKISDYNVQISGLSKLKDSLSTLQTAIKGVEKNQTSKLSTEDLKSALQTFVDTYNNTTPTVKKSTDYSIKSAYYSIRRDMNASVASGLGISFDRNGIASFDGSKIDKIVANEAQGIFPTYTKTETVTTTVPKGNSGQTTTTTSTVTSTVSTTLDDMVNGLFDKTLASTSAFSRVLDYNGSIASKKQSLENHVSKLERKQSEEADKLSNYQKMYTKQFTNLQNMLDSLSTVENSMTAYTNLLNKNNG